MFTNWSSPGDAGIGKMVAVVAVSVVAVDLGL